VSCSVDALDFSQESLAVLAEKQLPNVTSHLANASSGLPFPNGIFDPKRFTSGYVRYLAASSGFQMARILWYGGFSRRRSLGSLGLVLDTVLAAIPALNRRLCAYLLSVMKPRAE
jgi:hypothetical protein